MGLFSFIGGLIGGSGTKKAIGKASDLQYQADQQGIGEQRREFDTTQANFAPWLHTGTQALGGQADLTGLNGNDPQAAAIAQLQASPLYQSLYRNGLEASAQNASATGGLRGGNQQHSFYDVGEDTLAQVIQQQLGNLGALSGQGQNAAGSLSSAGQASTNNIIQLLQGGAAAQAGGILGKAGVNAQNWNNFGNFLDGGQSGGGGDGLTSLITRMLSGGAF